MKILANSLCLATSIALCSHATAETHEHTFKIKTKGGLAITSADKAYSFKVGGRIQMDYNNYDGVMNADQDGARGSKFFFRRGRIVTSGTIASDWGFKAEFNIGDNVGVDPSGDVTDFYIQYKGFEGNTKLTFGHQREPFGLETNTSSKNISTIERTTVGNVFDHGRAVGVQLSNHSDNWSYAAGIFEVGSDEDEDILFSYTARGTYLLMNESDNLIHIGGGVRIGEETQSRLRTRPGLRQVDGSDRISTGDINTDGSTHYNLEAAGVFGAAHVSAEYHNMSLDGVDSEDTDIDGYYLLAGWFLTGESRPYSTKGGSFSKVKPNNKSGAWELVASYSDVNLEDNGQGNNGTVLTLGANWYANSLVRAGINIVQADYDNAINGEDSGTGIAGRLQIVF